MAKRTVTTAYSLPTAHLRHSLRLALVSDIHERPPEDIIALLRHKRPDLILITGDTFERRDSEAETFRIQHEGVFRRAVISAAMKYNSVMMKVIDRRNRPSAEATYEFLAQAAKLAPIFLSLGNHEQRLTDDDHRFLSEHHITLLDNDDADVCFRSQPRRTDPRFRQRHFFLAQRSAAKIRPRNISPTADRVGRLFKSRCSSAPGKSV